jgi:hypothetical protein
VVYLIAVIPRPRLTVFSSGIQNVIGVACSHPHGSAEHHSVLLWSFADLIQPDAVLESPVEVNSFSVNPGLPHMVAGGCATGQVIIWDTSAHDVRSQLDKAYT